MIMMNHGDGNGRGHGHGRSDGFLQFIFVSCFYRCVTSPTKRVCKQPQQLTSRQHASNIMHSQGRATATETNLVAIWRIWRRWCRYDRLVWPKMGADRLVWEEHNTSKGVAQDVCLEHYDSSCSTLQIRTAAVVFLNFPLGMCFSLHD